MWPSADVLSQLLCAHNFVVLFCVFEWLVNLLLLVWFIPTGFPIQKLQSRVLHLHVFDYDRFSRDDSIGEVFLPLCQVLVDWLISLKKRKMHFNFSLSFFVCVCVVQVDFSEKPVFWKALKPPLKDKCGELLVSLCYHPTNSTLTLIALKARNLKAKDINGKSGSCRLPISARMSLPSIPTCLTGRPWPSFF